MVLYYVSTDVFLRKRRPPISSRSDTLSPYTTPFRSEGYRRVKLGQEGRTAVEEFGEWRATDGRGEGSGSLESPTEPAAVSHARSEAHTSELQSLMRMTHALLSTQNKH